MGRRHFSPKVKYQETRINPHSQSGDDKTFLISPYGDSCMLILFIEIPFFSPFYILAKQDHVLSWDKLVLFMLHSLFSLSIKVPFKYFRIVINSLLYYGNTFCFWSKPSKLFPPNRFKSKSWKYKTKTKVILLKITVKILKNKLTQNIVQIVFTKSLFWSFLPNHQFHGCTRECMCNNYISTNYNYKFQPNQFNRV